MLDKVLVLSRGKLKMKRVFQSVRVFNERETFPSTQMRYFVVQLKNSLREILPVVFAVLVVDLRIRWFSLIILNAFDHATSFSRPGKCSESSRKSRKSFSTCSLTKPTELTQCLIFLRSKATALNLSINEKWNEDCLMSTGTIRELW